MQHLAPRVLRLLAVGIIAAALYACAGAPVQEMSDARQAVAAAEQASAGKADSPDMAAARRFMQAAQAALDAGDYSTAREDAQLARQAALRALMQSQSQDASSRNPR